MKIIVKWAGGKSRAIKVQQPYRLLADALMLSEYAHSRGAPCNKFTAVGAYIADIAIFIPNNPLLRFSICDERA